MFNSPEKIIYFILFMVFFAIRKYYTGRFRDVSVVKSKRSLLDLVILSLTGVAMLVPIVYVFSDRLEFSDYVRPSWFNIIGSIILILACYILLASHRDLGSNWTPTLGIKKDHKLITKGVYKYLRHPMYAAHIYWAIGQIFLLPNFLAGFSLFPFVFLSFISRLRIEENMMEENFGEEYIHYRTKTGAIFPKIKL